MIRFITFYFYEINRDRPWLELVAKRKRKAFVLTLLLFTVVAIGVMAWILR